MREETFGEWMNKVNRIVVSAIGVGVNDLPDATWRDYYDDELSPQEAIEATADDGYAFEDVPEKLLELLIG